MQALCRAARLMSISPQSASATPQTTFTRLASKKAKGASKNGRKTIGRRLGPKVMDGEYVETGNVIVRQRGTKMMPGLDVGCGRDHTLFALAPGLVRFCRAAPRPGKSRGKVFVRVEPPPDHRWPSIQRKLKHQAIARYQGPILHAPR